ncbi:MAG: MoaD/ThiS family protein [Saprospiraceae bacterium]|jgi:molybdopterin converting factor small subunit
MEVITISVHSFGIARDIIGQACLELSFPARGTVSELRAQLLGGYPKLGGLKSLAIAVNAEYAPDSRILHPGDEIVVIPPVSGG